MFLRKKKKNGIDKDKKDKNSFDEEPEVDSEGYIIRKNNDNLYNQKISDKFYSSSESSDSETEIEKKIHFEIKPKNGFELKGPTADELKETVKQLSITSSVLPTKKQLTLNSTLFSSNENYLKRSTSQNLINISHNKLSNLGKTSISNISLSNISNLYKNIDNKLSNSINESKDENLSNGEKLINGQVHNTNYNGINFSNKLDSKEINTIPVEDRYAALRAFFDESNVLDHNTDSNLNESNLVKSTSLSKSISSFSTMVPNLTNKNVQTRRSNYTNGRTPKNFMSRCESYSSLSTDIHRATPLSMCSSRGPSPLTLGTNIPIAAAIQECISACFKGSNENKCSSVIYGILKIAFPTGILQILMNQPTINILKFKLTNASKINKINCNKDVILKYDHVKVNETNSEILFEINMNGLIKCLKVLFEQSPAARYYNVDILKYQLNKSQNTQHCPLQVVTHWKCEPNITCLKIDYKYNPYALSSLEPLRNVSFTVKVDANVLDFQSKPIASWDPITHQVCWKLEQISRLSEGCGLGLLKAKFTVEKGPTNPSSVLIQFQCANSTFSGVNFELSSSSYRVSVIKKQVLAGQYISDADSTINYACV